MGNWCLRLSGAKKYPAQNAKQDVPENGEKGSDCEQKHARGLWQKACRAALDSTRPTEDEGQRLLQDINSGHDLSQWEPDLCIQMLRIPAAQNYVAINKLLKKASKKWMLEFLECDGLGVLLESLEKLGARGFSSVADTFSQLQCVSCLRAVMNSQVGLEYIVQHREYTRQLANILMSNNNSVKLQVFELLCALCIYSSQGHSLALDSLTYFKQMNHGRRYRFDLVIHELQTADTVAYKTTLLAFVNCVILGASDIQQRNRIRTELFGVGLDKVLSELRFAEDEALQIQLKAFDDSQAKDEEHQEPLSVFHLFDVLYKKVSNTPQVLALQSLLLALSQVDPADSDSDRVWETLQEVVSEAQTKRKAVRKSSSVRTREFGTQTTGNRWLPTKRRASCTIGVQVDDVKISPALSLPMIGHESDSDLSSSPSAFLGSNSNLTLSTNGSVEICKNCLRKFVREEPQTPTSPTNPSATTEETSPSNIPNPETNSSPRKLSFTKIRKSTLPENIANQRSNSITVDEPLIKTIIPTQTSPTSTQLNGTNGFTDSSTANVPIPPPLPQLDITLSPSSVSSPPPPPPLPNELNSSPVPPPPPFPSTPSQSPIPPPPPVPSTLFSPLSPSLSLSPPPPPPMPFNTPPPPPMPFNNLTPSSFSSNTSTPQTNGSTSSFYTPPPPPPMSPALNGLPTPVSEQMIASERVADNMFTPSPYKTTSNYHTLPNRRLCPTDLETGYQKFNTLPKPSKKMKTLNWTKVPNQVIGKSIWASATLPLVPIDYSQIDELFCQKPRPKSLPAQSSTESHAPVLICLLDSKRSLTVNIFLKQFKTGAAGVLEALRNCEGLSAEKLKGLLRILPDEHEISLIKAHPGEVDTLETAERFYAELLNVPDYALRVQTMLQKEECPAAVAELTPQLESIVSMCDSLMHNSKLAEFLALLLQLGNYLNAGSYAGNAAGFKLNTLPKLLDTRANKPRMTFLHFAVDVAQTHNSDLLTFTDELSKLREMARNPLTSVEEEVKVLGAGVRKLDKQVRATKSKDILPKFKEFLKKSIKDIERLEKLVEEAKAAEKRLAVHFCEDPKKFQLEECFLLLADFFSKVKQAVVDNEQRKKQEERTARLEAEKTSASKLAVKPQKKQGKQKIFREEEETDLVDILMNEIKGGNFKLRRSLPAGNG